MADPWIRVHANLAEKPIALRAAKQLRMSVNEAIGHLVRFWGAMSRLGDDGNVRDLEDIEIEAWAGWPARREGEFAEFIRHWHTDNDGRVNEWDDYAGALEERRAKDRERQKRRRDERKERRTAQATTVGRHADDAGDVTRMNGVTSRGASEGAHADVTHESVPARAVRNETIRNERTTRSKTTTSHRTKRDADLTAAGVPDLLPAGPPAAVPPATSWLAPIADVWNAANGAGSFNVIGGQAAGVLGKLRTAGHDSAIIAAYLANYLEHSEPQYASITRFAATFEQWAPKLAVDPETGLLNEHGMAALGLK